jgi:uncharacterized protein YoxC
MDWMYVVWVAVIGVLSYLVYLLTKKSSAAKELVSDLQMLYKDIDELIVKYKEANADGNITKEELDSIFDEISDIVSTSKEIASDVMDLLKSFRGD